MRNGVAFRRVKGCTACGGAFKRVNRREMNRQHALRGDGCDEEEQQAEDYEPEDKGDEDQHQKGPGALRLLQAVIAIRLQLTPHFPQIRRRNLDAQLLRKVAGDEPETEPLPVKLAHQRPPLQHFVTKRRRSLFPQVPGARFPHALKIFELHRPGGTKTAAADRVKAEAANRAEQCDVWSRRRGRGACCEGVGKDALTVILGEAGEPAERAGTLFGRVKARWMRHELRHFYLK